MNAKISVNGVGWKVELIRWVLKIMWVSNENVPVMLGDRVAGFASINHGKVKGAMDIGVGVCEFTHQQKGTRCWRLARASESSDGRI
jgi:hypothetical protein